MQIRLLTAMLLFTATSIPVYADDDLDLLNLSLDKLANISVTSVSKKAEKASQAPAAIYVVTQEDIKRSGATSIPEALRMVPGIQVAQAGSSQWAITSRGNNDQFSNKLLVLMDGRTLYTPMFSGVYWDVQDTMLDDIERIEVIRGPGATLWGANAVNGVINIITKNAKDTVGGIVNVGTGTLEHGFVNGRYGSKVGENLYYRAYGKGFARDEIDHTGSGSGDAWKQGRAGFRMDYDKSAKENFTFQGDTYVGSNGLPITTPTLTAPFQQSLADDDQVSGANLLGRWNHIGENNSNTSLQLYYDYTNRENSVIEDTQNTFDADFQHSFTPFERNEMVWGLGYRLVAGDVRDSILINFVPDNRNDILFSAFVQDKIAVVPESLFLTLGSKFEHNDYSGFEYQPSAKLSWIVNDRQTVWASVARAVRTNNRANSDAIVSVAAVPTGIPAFPVGLAGSVGNPNLSSEELVAYEIGYKIQPRDYLSFDISGFYHDYDKHLASFLGTPFVNTFNGVPYLVLPIENGNLSQPRSQGIEIAANWEVSNDWKLAAGYSYLNFDYNNTSSVGFTFGGKSPRHQFNLRSYLNLPHDVSFDTAAYFVDNLKGIDVDAYIRLDARLAWKPVSGIELSIVGQNLLEDYHPEFSPFIYQSASEVGRSVYGKVAWQF